MQTAQAHLHSQLKVLPDLEKTGKLLGRGAFGKVIEMKQQDGTVVAGKKFYSEPSNIQSHAKPLKVRIEEECVRISQLDHPNVIQFLGLHYKSDKSDISDSDIPILIMECLPMSLTHYLEQNEEIPNRVKKSILLDVSKGLLYLHTQTPAILHRDINADNVLLTSNLQAKIADFGVSRIFEPDPAKYYMKMSTCPGSILYMPPEALQSDYKETRDDCDKLDVFSFGVLILHVYTQELPRPTGAFDEHNRPRNEVQRRQHLLNKMENHNMKQLAKDSLGNDPQSRPHTFDLVRRIAGLNGLAIIVDNHESRHGKQNDTVSVTEHGQQKDTVPVTEHGNTDGATKHDEQNGIEDVTDDSVSLFSGRCKSSEQNDTNEPNSLLVEGRQEVQDLEKLFTSAYGFLVLRFNNLSSEALRVLLTEVVKVTELYEMCAFALVILNKGRNIDVNNDIIVRSQNTLNHFFVSHLDNIKPKIFIFQTIVEKIDFQQHRLDIPPNSIVLTINPQNISQVSVLTEYMQAHCRDKSLVNIMFDDIKQQITDGGHHIECTSNLDSQFFLVTPQNDELNNNDLLSLNIEYEVSLAIWRPVRCETIKLLEQHRDEVLKIVRDSRIAKIVGASTSLAIGGTLTIAGLALIPFTFGASVGLTLAGAAVGVAGTVTSTGASIVSSIMSNSRVKKAHEHIRLDQQISEHVNLKGNGYNQALKSAGIAIDLTHTAVGVGGRLSVGIAKGVVAGVKTGIESGEAAVRIGIAGVQTVALAGGVVGGVALLVSAPLDIYQIVRNAYGLAKSGKMGKHESDKTCLWYIEQIRKMEEELNK